MESNFIENVVEQFEDLFHKNKLPSRNASVKEELSIFISHLIEQEGLKDGTEKLGYIRKAIILFSKLNAKLEPDWSAANATIDGRNGLRIYNNRKVINNNNYKFDCRIWVNVLGHVELELRIIKTTRGRTVENCWSIMVNLIDNNALAEIIDVIIDWLKDQLDDIKRGY